MADDASKQHQKEREREAGEADANALGGSFGAVRHIDEAMAGFDDMQAKGTLDP
jgi:hypothetical protein